MPNLTATTLRGAPVENIAITSAPRAHKIIWLSIIIFMWWYTWLLIMYQLNNFNRNLSHPLHFGIFQTVYTLSKWKLFMGLCLCFKIMVLLETRRTNYSVPCQKSKWGRYFDDRIHSSLQPKMLDVIQLLVYLKYFLIEPPGS